MKINESSNHDEKHVENRLICVLLHNYKKMKLKKLKEDP